MNHAAAVNIWFKNMMHGKKHNKPLRCCSSVAIRTYAHRKDYNDFDIIVTILRQQ